MPGYDEDWIPQLSRNMAKLLRHDAHNQGLLDDDDWMPADQAIVELELRCTAADLMKAVQQSSRPDECGARFELYISGHET